jgi:hypothetical protein
VILPHPEEIWFGAQVKKKANKVVATIAHDLVVIKPLVYSFIVFFCVLATLYSVLQACHHFRKILDAIEILPSTRLQQQCSIAAPLRVCTHLNDATDFWSVSVLLVLYSTALISIRVDGSCTLRSRATSFVHELMSATGPASGQKPHPNGAQNDDSVLLKQDFHAWPSETFHAATMEEACALWPSGTREDGTEYGLVKCNAKGIAEGRLLLGKGRMHIDHLKGVLIFVLRHNSRYSWSILSLLSRKRSTLEVNEFNT